MKRLLISGLMSLILLPRVGAAADAFYINTGNVDTPQVDAINFVNQGRFLAFGQDDTGLLYPYETANTINYTNKTGSFSGSGTMIGSPGFRFESYSTTTGLRTMANTFFNGNGAVVQAQDAGFSTAAGTTIPPCDLARVGSSYLLISATNIIVQAPSAATVASFIVGANGEMKLDGKKVDLSRSGLEVLPVWANPPGSLNGDTNFIPDIAIFDQYWGRTNFSDSYTLNSRGLWNGQFANAPSVPFPLVTNASFIAGVSGFTIPNPDADSYINTVDGFLLTITNFTGPPTAVTGTNLISFFLATNITKGAAFVGTPAGYDVQIGFTPSSQPNNFFDTIGVLFSVNVPNSTIAQADPAYIFLRDELASGGTTGILANVVGCPPSTYRPANYLLSRVPFFPGPSGNNGYPEQNFFVDSGAGLNNTNFGLDEVTNIVITNGEFSAYSAFLDNVVSRPQVVAGATVTDLPGRIRIFADNLNLTSTRLRGEGEIIIKTSNLISSSNAVIDCQNLSFSLASTNGSLKIQSLAPDGVNRLRGNIYTWSAVWSNTAIVIITNNYDFTNVVTTTPGTTNEVTNVVAVLSPLTNFINMGLHTLMLDARELTTILPVYVYDFATHSTNVVVDDNMTWIESVLIDGKSLTFNGDITIPGASPPVNPSSVTISIIGVPPPPDPAIQNWTYTNAPNVRFFTNNGYFFIDNNAHFGDDGPVPYSSFVNRGTVDAWSVQVKSDYFENTGSLFSLAQLDMAGGTGKLENGSSSSGGDSQFTASSLKFNNYQLTTEGALNLRVTSSLFDTGAGSSNDLEVLNGFNLTIKPPTGDLLGTSLQTTAPAVPSIQINHTWAGQNRGTNASGYLNNVALGKLLVVSDSPDPLFYFAGTTANNGLYVDLLDLSDLSDYTNQLSIDPNLVIYYAAAKLATAPPPINGVAQQPEEYLNGQFGGHLRWVPGFAGPNSSVDVLIYGQTVKVNRALRNSQQLDSDGDGVPNYADLSPFDLPSSTLTVETVGTGAVTPDYNGKQLALGKSYTVNAIPGVGYAFSKWTGGVSSTSPELTFVMESNLVLVANFVAQNFAPSAGSYSGLFFVPGDVEFESSGAFTASTTTGGNFSGQLQMGNNRYSLSGQFDATGRATNTIPRNGNSPLTVVLQVAGTSNARIDGTVSDGTWTADLQANLAVFESGNPAPFAGYYTIVFPGMGPAGDPDIPHGAGYGTVTVDQVGRIRLKGALADGSKLSQSATVSQDGRWPLYISLYKGQGQLLGWLNFENPNGEDLSGSVSWIKPANAKAKYYPAGFNLTVPANGSAYNSLASPLLNFSSGVVTFSGGNLTENIVCAVTLETNNKVIDLSSNGLKLSLKSPQGLFKGSVVDPATGKPIRFNGVLLQEQNFGAGFFLGTDLSGQVLFGP